MSSSDVSVSGKSLDAVGLHKSFGSLQVLRGVDLKINPGEVVGFVGANGAGKTTTMRILMGILGDYRGKVLFGGEPVDAVSRSRIGYMPEERGLYPKMKVGEQIKYFARLHGLGRKSSSDSTRKWLDKLGVSHREDDLLEELSLGNQQRVQLAAALVHRPDALILDEPFSGLDPLAVEVMSEVLLEYAASGFPVLFSSHQLALVEDLCSHVAIISGGEIVAFGEVESLRSEYSDPYLRLRGVPQAVAAAVQKANELNLVVQNTSEEVIVETAVDSFPAREILAQAVKNGVVSEFASKRKTLSEIFKAVVEPNKISDGDANGLEGNLFSVKGKM